MSYNYSNKMKNHSNILLLFTLFLFSTTIIAQNIPLPEHPRPDFQRPQWQNLNGDWAFAFDPNNAGLKEQWQSGKKTFDRTISVPFPWGAPLSGVEDEADIGWYQRTIQIDPAWRGKRIFLTIGASDWETTVWLDGQLLGSHRGGYTPFSFELTELAKPGTTQTLTVRADDIRRDFTLYGKQGYGNARGIWQTVYLETRGRTHLDALHFAPDIDRQLVQVTAYLPEPPAQDSVLQLQIQGDGRTYEQAAVFSAGKTKTTFEVPIANPHLWSLDDPFLYEVKASIGGDEVYTYFGMRKISVVNLPGTEYPYIALNNEPIYLQLALDQSYHPEGYYTFPSDEFMKEEIERSKEIGLNGIRTHIKVDIPRKLYWADKLGLLVMSDLPNSWGEPDAAMQAESEYTLRQMIKRDFNHPAIFSWVTFNETWGLRTERVENGKKVNQYLPSTQYWVASMYYLAKSLDPTRLVEDNSICCGRGHTETDINSWHVYLPGWEWDNYLKNLTENTYPGSTFDFEDGFTQGRQPNINSECGNVWGYEGSTGDVDWSWDYHRMINTFRQYPKVGGWLYTEHHDVINEWNGYWRYDRSEKYTGLEEIVPGMTLNDLHAPIYISTGNDICQTVKAGETASVPLYLSSMTGRKDLGDQLTLRVKLSGHNARGQAKQWYSAEQKIAYAPWKNAALTPLSVKMPDEKAVATLSLELVAADGAVLHRNFKQFEVEGPASADATAEVISVPAGRFSGQQWSVKQWEVLEGKKVNGAGKGYFEYTLPIPDDLRIGRYKTVRFLAEVSAKQLFAKDRDETVVGNVNYMLGGKIEPSKNPNAYPMSDETMFPSEVSVIVEGRKLASMVLPDDPADHRGALSWHHQLKDRKLREAGSYGYLLEVNIPKSTLRRAQRAGQLVVRLQVDGDGGLAVYGDQFGRYAINPSLVLE